MSQRSQEIIKRTKKAAKLAGSPNPDLTRKEVEDLHKKNKEKTYKQFMDEAMGRHQAALRTRMGGIRGNVATPETQERMATAKKKDEEEAEQELKSRHERLYKEKKERGIRATNKEGVEGWIKGGVFTAGDW